MGSNLLKQKGSSPLTRIPLDSVLGTSSKISGANLYSRLNYWIVACGGQAIANPPALQGVEAPTEAVITLTPTKFTFELEGEPEGVENLKLIVQAPAPQSNGVTRAYTRVYLQ